MRQVLAIGYDWELFAATTPYDVRDKNTLTSLIRQVRPDGVIHLAGVSFVPDSFKNPEETYHINFLGTLNLFQALNAEDFSGRLLYVSSGDVYGLLDSDLLPATEKHLPRPLNPYAVSKLAAEALAYQWSQAHRFERVVIARPFNHVGPGQRADFVLPSMARQIVRIRKNLQPPVLLVGDIDVTRDFLDVKDIVHAYICLLDHGINGQIYNVCSGIETNVRECIKRMLAIAGVEAEIQRDPDRMRPVDLRRAVGDNTKLMTDTGWCPAVPLDESLNNLLNDWECRES